MKKGDMTIRNISWMFIFWLFWNSFDYWSGEKFAEEKFFLKNWYAIKKIENKGIWDLAYRFVEWKSLFVINWPLCYLCERKHQAIRSTLESYFLTMGGGSK